MFRKDNSESWPKVSVVQNAQGISRGHPQIAVTILGNGTYQSPRQAMSDGEILEVPVLETA
jgi:hypothetical protein